MKERGGRPAGVKNALLRRLAWLLVAIAYLAAIDGCTRSYYRKATDNEVNDILAEKDQYADWKIEQFHVYPDPRARFADPTNPDRPPMPPDDEAAWRLSPHPQVPGASGVGNVQGTGYLEIIKQWDAQNRAEIAALDKKNAERLARPDEGGGGRADSDSRKGPVKTYFDEPLQSAHGGFLLNMDQAVELGVINNRTYQTIRETLYLTALPVTQQRFSFAYQWAASEDAARRWAGASSPVGYQNNWTLGTTASASKLFSTGALLTAGFANSVIFNFTGPHGVSTSSIFNLNLVQPLLQGGGKAVNLEPLTQAERNLLYAIRGYARFREQFYSNIVFGNSLQTSLIGVNLGSTNALAALGIASTDVSGGAIGFLPTLYRQSSLALDKSLVKELERALRIYEGYQEGGLFSPLQVDQVRSQLLTAKNAVLADQQFVDNALDQFKQSLGVPVNMPLILDDTPAQPVTRQLDRYYEVLGDSDAAYKLVEKQDQVAPEKLRGVFLEIFTKSTLARGTEFQKKVPLSWNVWAKLTNDDLKARQEKLRTQRRTLLDAKTDLEMLGKTLSADDAISLREAEFELDLSALEQDLRRYEARPWEQLAKEDQRTLQRTKLFRLVAYSAETVLVWARNERYATVNALWPALPPAPLEQLDVLTADVDLAQQTGVQVALQNRWDLMNARAQVTDAWRQLRVTANALLGAVNVQYNLQSQTPTGSSNPFAFSAAGTNQTLNLNFQLPLNRLAQRNAYRTAQINYQQARRNLINLEDNVAAQVRLDIRQLHLFAENYKIQQKLVQSLYSQVESTLEVIVAPADPDQLKSAGTSSAASAAALTNQYLQALNGLNNAQTKMFDIWLSYLATRIVLYQDLERLPLDNRGVWTDEFAHPVDASRDAIQRGQHPGESFLRARLVVPTAVQRVE